MIDNFDIKILKEFSKIKEGEEISEKRMINRLSVNLEEGETPWNIMRIIFPKGHDKEDKIVKRRIKRMEKLGLFIITKNSPTKYMMILENVKFKKFKFPDRVSEAVLLKIKNKWEIFEI